MKRKLRRGAVPALVLCLFLALGSILAGAVALAATSSAAAERDYRRSQALALAEAGLTEARAGLPPHGGRPLGEGTYSWSAAFREGGRLIIARGEVTSASGARITRSIRALLARDGAGRKVRSWEEGP